MKLIKPSEIYLHELIPKPLLMNYQNHQYYDICVLD